MQFWKPFTFIFEDPDWLKKLAMLGLVGFANLVPGLGSLFMGFVFAGVSLEIVRKVINKETPTIPNLDIGKQFMDGLKLWVVNLVYSIPIIVIGIVIAIVVGIGMAVGYNVFDSNGSSAGTAIVVLVWAIIACFGFLAFLYGLLVAFITPEIYARFAQSGSIKDALQFKAVFKTVFKKPGPYLMAVLGVILLGIVGGIASSILTSIGAIALVIGSLFGMAVAMAYILLGTGHFYGQAHNLATEETL